VGRYYRIQTDDGRSGTCSFSGFTGGGFYRATPAVKMTGMGPLK
jgi:hypothetical protein